MKIIMILTNRFDPDVRVYKEAKYLVENGHQVQILCWDRENEYRDKSIEELDDIIVKRFFPYSKYGTGIKQIIPFFKFIIEVSKYLGNVDYDYLHCHDLDGIFTGYFTNGRKKPLIFDMHEYYEMQKSNKLSRSIVKLIVNKFQKKASKIIYVNESQIAMANNNIKEKSYHLPNYPDINNFIRSEKSTSKKLRISYIGVVGQYQQLKNLMEACASFGDVQISIHGQGIATEKLKAIAHKYNNVNVTGKYHFAESVRLYNECDILYVVYPMNNIQNKISEPIKFFEAIVTKTPIICNKNTRIGDFVESNGIGYTVDGDSINDIHNVVNRILNSRNALERCKNNLEKISKKYTWQNVVGVLSELYDS